MTPSGLIVSIARFLLYISNDSLEACLTVYMNKTATLFACLRKTVLSCFILCFSSCLCAIYTHMYFVGTTYTHEFGAYII